MGEKTKEKRHYPKEVSQAGHQKLERPSFRFPRGTCVAFISHDGAREERAEHSFSSRQPTTVRKQWRKKEKESHKKLVNNSQRQRRHYKLK